MDENKLLERIRASAQDVQVPDCLKPEEIIKKMNAAEQCGGGTGNKRRSVWKKSLVSAAAVLLCIGIVAAAGRYLMSGSSSGDASSKASAPMESAAAEPESGERISGSAAGTQASAQASGGQSKSGGMAIQAERISMNSLYTQAQDYGEIYDSLKAGEMKEERAADDMKMESESSGSDGGLTSGTGATSGGADGAESVCYGYSSTNVQVEGVDEADIVKNDGSYLYILSGRMVKIVRTENEQLELVSVTTLKNLGSAAAAYDMYVNGDILQVVAGSKDAVRVKEDSSEIYSLESREKTLLLTYDISDRTNPVLKGSITQDGAYQTSRRVGDYVYLFTKEYLGVPEGSKSVYEKEETVPEWLPEVNDEPISAGSCYLPAGGGNLAWIISSVSGDKPGKAADTKMILSNGTDAYISTGSIILQEISYEYNGDATNLAKFTFHEGKIKAESAAAVNGTIRDVFAINEQEGFLRVLTTSMDHSSGQEKNNLYILEEDLSLAGCIEGMAPGESIYSARFMGDTGYFVTYRNTDPLFSVDLSDPYQPRVIGELKVTGFSEYLHFWGDDQLLGIGYETDPETGRTQGLKLSMFDISDPANMKEVNKYVLEDFSYSPALYNYKSVLAHAEKNVIGFAAQGDAEKGGKDSYLVFSYSQEEGFTCELKENLSEEAAGGQENIRGIYTGDSFYLVSPDSISSYNMKEGYTSIATLGLS